MPVYKRPRLTLLPTPTRNSFQYVVESDWDQVFPSFYGAPYALEYADDLRATAWRTNQVGTLSRFPTTNDLAGTNLNHRFYRLNALPLEPYQP